MMKNYRKTNVQPMRPYIVGEDLDGISIKYGELPGAGGMIAHDPKNTGDKWYMTEQFFIENYEEVT